MITQESLTIMDKLRILSDAAKYDVACTSSGVERRGDGNGIGNSIGAGICHSFSQDGRCISLLKILYTNECVYDCKYCLNRASNDIVRTSFTPEEICRLTVEFYRRNYIEGLFLSSGVKNSPDETMEEMVRSAFLLRNTYNFQGYIHLKAIPGASPELVQRAGYLADRMSVNLELPTADALKRLAPHKSRRTILRPMRQIQLQSSQNKEELALYRHTPRFVPAGQSTQMIVGAAGESDLQIISVAEALYKNFSLKRVFYSAFVSVNDDKDLPALPGGPPLLREHRLYQADWLLRFYGFQAEELLSEKRPNFDPFLDPKCGWAVSHLEYFPVEINKADYRMLLRVPGIGTRSARKIMGARRYHSLDFSDLRKMGVVLKRAVFFITCRGRQMYPVKLEEKDIVRNILGKEKYGGSASGAVYRQLSLFDNTDFTSEAAGGSVYGL